MFNDLDPYYKEATKFPKIVAPTFTYSVETKKFANTSPNWDHLIPIQQIIHESKQAFIFEQHEEKRYIDNIFKSQTIKQNLDDFEQLSEVKKFRKKVGIKFPKLNFSQSYLDIYDAISDEVDILDQRGDNPFVHKRNFLKQEVKIMGQFKSMKNLKNITSLLEENYIGSKIILYPVNYDFYIFKHDGIYKNLNIVRIDDSLDVDVNIIFLQLEITSNILQQMLNMSYKIFKCLNHGGCFIIRTMDIKDQNFIQFIYLFQKMFKVISFSNIHILETFIGIGCYGYNKKVGQKILGSIFNQVSIDAEQVLLFKIQEIFMNDNFFKPISIFHLELLRKRSSQINLINCLKGQSITSDEELKMICDELREESKRKREQQRFKEDRGYGDRQHYSNKSDTKIINVIPERQETNTKDVLPDESVEDELRQMMKNFKKQQTTQKAQNQQIKEVKQINDANIDQNKKEKKHYKEARHRDHNQSSDRKKDKPFPQVYEKVSVKNK